MKESLILPKNKFLMVDKNHKKPYPFVSVDSGTIEGFGYTNKPCWAVCYCFCDQYW